MGLGCDQSGWLELYYALTHHQLQRDTFRGGCRTANTSRRTCNKWAHTSSLGSHARSEAFGLRFEYGRTSVTALQAVETRKGWCTMALGFYFVTEGFTAEKY